MGSIENMNQYFNVVRLAIPKISKGISLVKEFIEDSRKKGRRWARVSCGLGDILESIPLDAFHQILIEYKSIPNSSNKIIGELELVIDAAEKLRKTATTMNILFSPIERLDDDSVGVGNKISNTMDIIEGLIPDLVEEYEKIQKINKIIEELEATQSENIQEELNVTDLTSHSNSKIEYYKALAKKAETEQRIISSEEGFDTNFESLWDNLIRRSSTSTEEIKDYLKKGIRNKILIDIAGQGGLSDLARDCEAKLQVIVNKYRGGSDRTEGGLRILTVQEDALLFISKIKSNSVIVAINGLDSIIIKNPEYHQVLAEEILRITKVGGLIFGMQSDALFILRRSKYKQNIMTLGVTSSGGVVLVKLK